MISALDLFTIGIGPSSSHSVGPMRAAKRFVEELDRLDKRDSLARIEVSLYGSLALTGKGHGTDKALILGLLGHTPESVNPDEIDSTIEAVREQKELTVPEGQAIPFDEAEDLRFLRRETLPSHPNGMRFRALDSAGGELSKKDYYSIGGGFIIEEGAELFVEESEQVPHPFHSGQELLALADSRNASISQIVLDNESVRRSETETRAALLDRWRVMQECVERGCRSPGILPGGLKVKRRAPDLYEELSRRPESAMKDPLTVLDWVDLYALAVNEENAAGGRVVTAPTNGAAGIIPAVLHYYDRFCPASSEDGISRFLLTAAAIGMLYKENASISGAEVGCQGEVGVACSMAAGALAEVLGGTPAQVEMAAEIGMEHNLGLTCDPIGGLVQVPCIERNAMGAVKAINACRLAIRSDGQHRVSLDRVIDTMRRTGADMSNKYKETSRGGLAVNFTEC